MCWRADGGVYHRSRGYVLVPSTAIDVTKIRAHPRWPRDSFRAEYPTHLFGSSLLAARTKAVNPCACAGDVIVTVDQRNLYAKRGWPGTANRIWELLLRASCGLHPLSAHVLSLGHFCCLLA